MANARDINDNEFYRDFVDTPEENTEQQRKRERLKDVISMGKVHLLGHKWTYEKDDKASDEIITKAYALHKQRGMEGLGKACH